MFRIFLLVGGMWSRKLRDFCWGRPDVESVLALFPCWHLLLHTVRWSLLWKAWGECEHFSFKRRVLATVGHCYHQETKKREGVKWKGSGYVCKRKSKYIQMQTVWTGSKGRRAWCTRVGYPYHRQVGEWKQTPEKGKSFWCADIEYVLTISRRFQRECILFHSSFCCLLELEPIWRQNFWFYRR